MQKFHFNMESVLKFREDIENRKKEALAVSLQKVAAEKKHLDGLLDSQKKNLSRSAIAGELDVIMLQQVQAFSTFLNTKIQQQKKILLQAQKDVKKKRLELAEAAKKKMIMENLKEKKFQEHCQKVNKEEQKLLDEVGVSAYCRRAE